MFPLIRTWPRALCGLFVFSLVHVHIASLSLFLKRGLRADTLEEKTKTLVHVSEHFLMSEQLKCFIWPHICRLYLAKQQGPLNGCTFKAK